MKDRPLEAISDALKCKCDALKSLGRNTEFLQCAEDNNKLWAMARGPVHPSTIEASHYFLEALMHNKEYHDAEVFARTLWEIIHSIDIEHVDNILLLDKRQTYLAMSSNMLALAIFKLAESGGIPAEEKQKAGEEAIARARECLEVTVQAVGPQNASVAASMAVLADVLAYFLDTNEETESLRLYEQAIAIYTRCDGATSIKVGSCKNTLATMYVKRAVRAHIAKVKGQYGAHLELAVPIFREAGWIFRALNLPDRADAAFGDAYVMEDQLRQVAEKAAAEAAAALRR